MLMVKSLASSIQVRLTFYEIIFNSYIERYDRENPCRGIKQIMTGFRKWADRYIGGCGGQANHKHQVNRANKFYNIFKEGLSCSD